MKCEDMRGGIQLSRTMMICECSTELSLAQYAQKFDWITCASIGSEILVTQQEVKNTFRHFKLRNNHHMHPNTTLVAPMTCGPRELSPFWKTKPKTAYCTIPKLDLSTAS